VIGRLSGLVAEIGEEEVVIDVGGVGYVVRCGARTLQRLIVGESVVLNVETQWTETAGPRLYGFVEREARGAFVLLLAIQGVGPKAALAVLDVLPPAELAQAVALENRALVARAQGVGPKLAQRIIAELKGKPLSAAPLAAAAIAPRAPAPTPTGDAVAALMGLGVAEQAARRVVEQASTRLGEDAGEPALIKAALQELGR
jgi:Holliday junction DNA helicase RuvA